MLETTTNKKNNEIKNEEAVVMIETTKKILNMNIKTLNEIKERLEKYKRSRIQQILQLRNCDKYTDYRITEDEKLIIKYTEKIKELKRELKEAEFMKNKNNEKMTIEKYGSARTMYYLNNKNKKGEELIIELMECEDPKCKNSLPQLWKQHGYIDRVLDKYICIETHVIDLNGNCYEKYNPQVKFSENENRNMIDFNWMFENTEENKQKLLNETIKRFEECIE